MTPEALPRAFTTPELRWRLQLLADSHRLLTGADLVGGDPDVARALWASPRVIVAHGTEADPIFFFANRAGLDLFKCTVEQFTSMPSRLSAEPLAQEERESLLERVRCHGFVDDYAGVRVSSDGRRFRIEKATIWNLTDAAGRVHGQAATFDIWTELPR